MTESAARVYDAMCELEDKHGGWPVPLEVIAAGMGIASRSNVYERVQQLVRIGVVEKSPFPKGGYRVKRRKET